tara:strand:+ start:4220 stop:5386 length:1167 start_codon:yes stop_codon:yes gene_type:complete
MTFKKFESKDILYNVLETNPEQLFEIHDSKVYRNKQTHVVGEFTSSVPNVPTGFVSLYEINVDRNRTDTGLVYPFVTKGSSLVGTKTVSTTSFNTDFLYGDVISGSYPLSSSIKRDFYQLGQARPEVDALKNTLNNYIIRSTQFAYSSSLGNKATQPLNLISIPSILFGSSLKPTSFELNFYISGTLIGTLKDESGNGEMIQTGPEGSTGSGSVAGVALYDEGFLVLTGSWELDSTARNYLNDPGNLREPSWLYFGVGANDGTPAGTIPSSSYAMEMKGINKIPTLTMFAHADKGEMNHSNNPTYITFGQDTNPSTGSYVYAEPTNLSIKNIVSSSYADPTGSFQKTTYISKIGIYDEDKNLLGIATMATPIKKTQNRDLTFKLKLDI